MLNLLNSLQKQFGYTYVFISHNLSVVKHVSDRIAVMYLGKIVEMSDYQSLFKEPLHPYTQALLSAIPIARVGQKRDRLILEGDVPALSNRRKAAVSRVAASTARICAGRRRPNSERSSRVVPWRATSLDSS